MRPSLIALRTLLVGLALALASLALARGLIHALRATTPPEARAHLTEGAGRLAELLRALPEFASRPDAVLVVGSSLVQHGFSPEAFEARLGRPLTAYNLGIPGADPEVQALLARRVARAFQASGQRARLTVVEFTPFQATHARARAERFREHAAVKKALLLHPEALAREAGRSPQQAAHLGALWALGGTSPLAVTDFLAHRFLEGPAPSWWPGPSTEAEEEARRRAWGERFQAGLAAAEGRPVPEWDARRRGETRWLFEQTRQAYQELLQRRRAPEVLEAERQWRVETSDLLELRLDARQVDAFIEAVRTLASVSRQTRVLVAPRNPAWAQPTPEGRARLAEALARMERETGVAVVDLGDSPDFTPEDFMDVTHLNETRGRPRLSRRLADVVAPLLGGPVAAEGAP